MARPKNADGQRTRQAILDAALKLFADKGYFGTSLRDVAAAVGVRESALYNYFRNKEALFDALIAAHQHGRDERMSQLAHQEPITDPRAFLERLTVASLESALDPREQLVFRLVMSDGIRLHRAGRFNLHERLASGPERMLTLMRQLVDEGWLRKSDPAMLWVTFIGPLLLLRHIRAVDPDAAILRDPRAFARHHVDQFLQGAGAVSPRSTAPRRGRPRAAAHVQRSKPASRQPS